MPGSASLRFDVEGEAPIELTDFDAFVAGYTGRDAAAVQEHIDELEAIGVAPPPTVPMFYEIDPAEVTSASEIRVAGDRTSGEVEPLYIRHDGRYYLGVASDHTDRQVETEDIGKSKQACPTPVSANVLLIGDADDLAATDLDDAVMTSRVDGRRYQEGRLDGLRTAADVVERLLANRDLGDRDFVCLGGTLPIIGGAFDYGDRWELELQLGDRTLTHRYDVSKEKNA